MFRNLFRLSRPLNILFAALTYVLGLGLARYLGNPFHAVSFWLGLVGVLLTQTTMSLLAEVYRSNTDPIVPDETIAERKSLHDAMLYFSIASLAALAVIAFLLYVNRLLSPSALLFLGLSLLLTILYSVPPARLVNLGFGELILAIHLAYVIPSIGFLLQATDYHRLLGMIVFPLTSLAFACFLVLDFPSFAQDQKYNRRTLLVRLGWERAVPLHNALIAIAYLTFLAAPAFGFSLTVLWPAFLTLPFAILQIVGLRNIALGGRPVWDFLTATAIAVFGLTAYFLTLTFWLR
ncbi:MAG TPA: prenyltransferase [Anaerolineales bacterium]|nr:prenyltransferase [Anaerolineales bacterium]